MTDLVLGSRSDSARGDRRLRRRQAAARAAQTDRLHRGEASARDVADEPQLAELGTAGLDGRGALVTGGAGGFGRASALELAHAGAAVVLMGRTAHTLDASKRTIEAIVPGARVATYVGDAGLDRDIASAVAATVEHAGGIDIVVGVPGGSVGPGSVVDTPAKAFSDDLLLNAVPAYLAVHHAAPHMKAGGSFVFISSTAARMSFQSLAGYCAGKAALDQFVQVAANELGPQGIRVNAIRPGLVHTDGMKAAFGQPGYAAKFLPLIPLGRTGEPADVGRVVAFLAGDGAAWVTGVSIPVDGGNELRGAPVL